MSSAEFNYDAGTWGSNHSGPAVATPDLVKNIVVKPEIHIEFLNISNPNTGFYAKNHIVSSVNFADENGIKFTNSTYYSAQISMELASFYRPVKSIEGRVSSQILHPILLYSDLNSTSTSLEQIGQMESSL
jgi:hypothetical protein